MICLDSSVVAKILLAEEQSDLAQTLYDFLLLEGTPIVAPPLLPIEMTNTLRKQLRKQGGISAREAAQLLEAFLAFPIAIHNPPGLHQRAFALAEAFGLPATYDAHYLALAEFMNCDFWTADWQRYRRAERQMTFVRWIGDYQRP